MMQFFIHLSYCYEYLVNQISIGLLLYSHIPTAIAALGFGLFVFLNTRRLSSFLLFLLSLSFAAWCLLDLGSWFSFLGAESMMFAWGLTDFFSLIFFAVAYYFLYVFVSERDLPFWQKLTGLAILAPSAYWTFSGSTLTAYDTFVCEAGEYSIAADYVMYARLAFIFAAILFTIVSYVQSKEKEYRKRVSLAGTGVSFFLFAFFLFSYLANLNLVLNVWEYAYNIEIYGLFGMPIFLAYFGFLIVRYHAFNLKIFGAQALITALVVVLGSEFAFASSLTNQILVGTTLLLTIIIGFILIKSVRREIEQREHIEKLAEELELTNKRQEGLIHFIGHEVKGFLTKAEGAFAALVDGDFGPLPNSLKPFAQHALGETRTGVESVVSILKASNQKKGTISYQMTLFDLCTVVKESVEKARGMAEGKGLKLSFAYEGTNQTCSMTGDKTEIGDHVLRNLIENSINYTPSGSIEVSLTKVPGKYIFAVKDTGVGITDEDKKRLFTEGGHGKDSQKVNVHSTGYGLFIAKNIVDAHHGTIRAESEGAGKGSTFIVEFPT